MSKFVGVLPAEVAWQVGEDGKAVPWSAGFEDIYFNRASGLAETDYVFLQHNDLPQRFKQATGTFRVIETGFGSGLNFLLTAQQWLQAAPTEAVLHYVSIEQFPMAVSDWQRVHRQFANQPFFMALSEQLAQQWPFRLPGRHDVWLMEGRIHLSLWWGDVNRVLPQLPDNLRADAWFLDGFAPSKNPEMWQEMLFKQMARLSGEQTTFATFTAAGIVRRGLHAAGFAVQKDKGFGKKREMLFGQFEPEQAISYLSQTPWFALPPALPDALPKTALVVGAGLAGATLAYALAEAGFAVTVLEQEPTPAGAAGSSASGNAAGAIHPLVTADWNLRSQFYLQGYEATLRWLKPWIESGEVEGDLSGLVQLAVEPKMQQRLQQAIERVGLPEDFAVWKTAAELKASFGLETPFDGLYFPQAGWVVPRSVVNRCLQHPNIQLVTDCKVEDWQRMDEAWQVKTTQGVFTASVLGLTTGAVAEKVNQQLQMPIRPVKGQVSSLGAVCVAEKARGIQPVVTHRGYSVWKRTAQGDLNSLVTGATFEAPDLSKIPSPEADDENMEMLLEALPDSIKPCDRVSGRVSFRPTTPDHLPILGGVPDETFFQKQYLSQNASKMPRQFPPQQYQTGLVMSNGHGPRGLMSVFLAAEEIVRQLLGQDSLLSEPTRIGVHPARFRVRQWRQRR